MFVDRVQEQKFWTWTPDQALRELGSSSSGLSDQEAKERAKRFGANRPQNAASNSRIHLFLRQISNPLVGILIFAAVVSAFTQEWTDATIVVIIIAFSAVMGFFQEYRASKAVGLLLERIAHFVTVCRGGEIKEIPAVDIVPGDLVQLNAGTMIPADGLLLKAKDLFVNQAVLTGESMPAEKSLGTLPESASLNMQSNSVFAGTSVRSGFGEMLVVQTGNRTFLGQISNVLQKSEQETDFEKGLKQFGYLLTRIMIVFVLIVLVGNILLEKPIVDSLLFSIALAVGLSPELLPAILTVTLAQGAVRMAKKGVIVRRLNCIESLGNMQILCCDKTGTLTEGRVTLKDALNLSGEWSERVANFAFLNASLQTGIKNALDDAILESLKSKKKTDLNAEKLDEIPYDFIRRRLTVVVGKKESIIMIMKGAVAEVLSACSSIRDGEIVRPFYTGHKSEEFFNQKLGILDRMNQWGSEGFRVLAVASRQMQAQETYTIEDEKDFIFEGFLLFQDPPHSDAVASLKELRELGVETKIITGDNQFVARAVAKAVGFENVETITGEDLNELSHEALIHRLAKTTIFAEVDPQQKENIVRLLKKTNRIVGYMGDGINDAPALLAADVGISVESAVDVAKESADLVLTQHALNSIVAGIREGRVTFANTLKYVFVTTSANFGNMISMAVASLFLPFLPLTAAQVLLNNLLSDIPALGIGADSVDPDWRKTPHRWSNNNIRRFMVRFGLVSTAFDLLTFAVLLFVFKTSAAEFRTGWFFESLLTEVIIIFVIRTSRPIYQSRPGGLIVFSSLFVIALTAIILFTPLRSFFGFVSIPLELVGSIVLITILYGLISEILKSSIVHRADWK